MSGDSLIAAAAENRPVPSQHPPLSTAPSPLCKPLDKAPLLQGQSKEGKKQGH